MLYEMSLVRNEKGKNYMTSYSKNMANFEVFCVVILSSINLLFQKSSNTLYIVEQTPAVTFFKRSAADVEIKNKKLLLATIFILW